MKLDRLPLEVLIRYYRKLKQYRGMPSETKKLMREIEDYLWYNHRL